MAGCLQEVFKVQFTDFVLTSTTTHNSTSVEIVREELLNVYGPVRLTTFDIDDWYINMKNRLLTSLEGNSITNTSDSLVRYIPYTSHTLGAISEHVISFHYISEAESTLLFKLLSAWAMGLSSPSTATELIGMWPRNRDVGDYARPLKSLAEAKILLEKLFHISVHAS